MSETKGQQVKLEERQSKLEERQSNLEEEHTVLNDKLNTLQTSHNILSKFVKRKFRVDNLENQMSDEENEEEEGDIEIEDDFPDAFIGDIDNADIEADIEDLGAWLFMKNRRVSTGGEYEDHEDLGAWLFFQNRRVPTGTGTGKEHEDLGAWLFKKNRRRVSTGGEYEDLGAWLFFQNRRVPTGTGTGKEHEDLGAWLFKKNRRRVSTGGEYEDLGAWLFFQNRRVPTNDENPEDLGAWLFQNDNEVPSSSLRKKVLLKLLVLLPLKLLVLSPLILSLLEVFLDVTCDKPNRLLHIRCNDDLAEVMTFNDSSMESALVVDKDCIEYKDTCIPVFYDFGTGYWIYKKDIKEWVYFEYEYEVEQRQQQNENGAGTVLVGTYEMADVVGNAVDYPTGMLSTFDSKGHEDIDAAASSEKPFFLTFPLVLRSVPVEF